MEVREGRGCSPGPLHPDERSRRAGVAPATAYTYFSSKSHLVAEVFWRRLSAGVLEPDPGAPRSERVK